VIIFSLYQDQADLVYCVLFLQISSGFEISNGYSWGRPLGSFMILNTAVLLCDNVLTLVDSVIVR
jgi:hypothetical protein